MALRAMINFDSGADWHGTCVVPPGSFVEEIINLFSANTDIPLELPLAATLSHISGLLNARGVTYEIGGKRHSPKLWTVVLADSGSGKTFATDRVADWLKGPNGETVVPELMCASSAAQFVENVQMVPKGLLIRDEFGQFLNQIQNQRHMEEIKDVLLKAYSGGPVSRMTKERQVNVHDHAFSILGITVGETFESQIGAESLVDGFAQRFNYLIAKKDPKRTIQDFPLYFEDWKETETQARFERVRKGWLKLATDPRLKEKSFTFSAEAIAYFKASFRDMFGNAEVPESFYRRAAFSIFPYAVIFHAICRKPGRQIMRESMSLAVRMVGIHLDHARKLLNNYGLSELEKTIRKAEKIRDRKTVKGEELKPRDLISGIREIKSAAQAHSLMVFLK